MGRRKEPIELLQARGKKHLTKDEIKERQLSEVKAFDDNIEPPSYLSAKLKRRFNSLASELLRIEIMKNLDVDALARYVYAEEQHQLITKQLKKVPMVDEIDTYDKLSKMQDRYFKQARLSATDLGLTISSRCKLVVPKPEEKPPETEGEKRFANRI